MTTEQLIIGFMALVILALLAALFAVIRENTKLGGKLADYVPTDLLQTLTSSLYKDLSPAVTSAVESTEIELDDDVWEWFKPRIEALIASKVGKGEKSVETTTSGNREWLDSLINRPSEG